MPNRKQILAELEDSRAAFQRHVESLPEEAWDAAGPGAWSPVQIVLHVAMVEAATLTSFRRAESPEGAKHRLTLRERLLPIPVAAVRYPVVRVEAPSWVRPEHIPSREEAMRKLASARKDLLQFTASRTDEELETLAVRHPFFGWMSAAHALRLTSAHERRHLTQMQRLALLVPQPRVKAAAA